MTYTDISSNQKKAVQGFQGFDADTQLALLWFIYEELKGSLTPKGGPNTSGFAIAQGIVDRIQLLPQEQQLQAQRDVVAGRSSEFSNAYGDLNSSNRLAFWYLLAQRMENGQLVNVPSNYQLSSEAQGFFNAIKGLGFNDQITFMRNVVSCIGPEPKEGAVFT